MLCRYPYMNGLMPCPCGKCMPCRINRRRLWTHRIMLEACKHQCSAYITLTYSDDKLPVAGHLNPRDVQLWLKRIRKAFPGALRFFLVGEYGDDSWRPHYHVALFGYPNCQRGRTHKQLDYCCPVCELVKNTWGKGGIDVATLEEGSARYIAGYCLKKMTSKDDPRLKGRFPEFARMSLKPGIGASAMDDIYRTMVDDDGVVRGMLDGDVPTSLRYAGKSLPFGRYLRRKLREHFKFDNVGTPKERLYAWSVEMSDLFLDSFKNEKNSCKSLSQILVDRNLSKIRSIEARAGIFVNSKTI